MGPRASALAVLALLLVFVVPRAVAQPAPEDIRRAKELYLEARGLQEAGEIRDALERLKEAYSLFPADEILLSMANRHLDLDELEEADQLLAGFQPGKEKLRPLAESLRAQVTVGLTKPIPVSLSADAESATVGVDGGAPVDLPARLELARGPHRFVFQAPGREDVALERVLRGRSEVELTAALPVVVGQWKVSTSPAVKLEDVRVSLDGEPVDLSAQERSYTVSAARALPPGAYRVTCSRGLDERTEANLQVRAGQVALALCVFRPPASGANLAPWAWTMIGVAAAALGTGLGLVGEWASVDARYSGHRSNSTGERRYQVSPTNAIAGGALLGVSALSGVASGLLFGLDD